MAVYQRPFRPTRNDREDFRERDDRPDTYSMAHIEFIDGTSQDFRVKASPTLVPHIARDMMENGYLTLWNESETLCVATSQVKSFRLNTIDDSKN